jgi:hypothetical protein
MNKNKKGLSFKSLTEFLSQHNVLLYDHTGFCYNLELLKTSQDVKYLCIAFHNNKFQKINMQITKTFFECSEFPEQYLDIIAKDNGRTTLPTRYWGYYTKIHGQEMIHSNIDFVWKIKHDLHSYRSVIVDLDLQTVGTRKNAKYLSAFELSWINSRSKKFSICHPRIVNKQDESIEYAIANFRIKHYFQNMENILSSILSHHFNNYLEVSELGFRRTVSSLKLNNFFELMTALTSLHTNQMFEVSASSEIYEDSLISFAQTYKVKNRKNFLNSELEQHDVMHCEHLIDMRTLSRYYVFRNWYRNENLAFYRRCKINDNKAVFDNYCTQQFFYLREKYNLKYSDEVADLTKMVYPRTTNRQLFYLLTLTSHSNLNTYLNIQDKHWKGT